MNETPRNALSQEQKAQFQNEGYCILEKVIPAEYLELLRDECAHWMAVLDAEMDALGVETLGITHKGNRYFIGGKWHQSDRLPRFLWSELMAGICRDTLGDTAFLFNEQYVVKAAEKGMHFGWHQDSGYIGHDHKPYLSCWCALDDVNEENGTVYLLPYDRAGTREWVRHETEEGTNDKIGYKGDDPGVPVICEAGSVAVFSSTVFHRSGANETNRMRRIYLAQYSAEPILNKDGSALWGDAEPVLRDGQIVEAPIGVGA